MKIYGLHALAIGDLYVPCDIMADAIRFLKPASLTTLHWRAADISDLQARLLTIEKHGPGSVPPPQEIWESLPHVEFLMTHLCPLSEELIESAPNLRIVGLCRGGTDSIDKAALERRHIRVFNAAGRNNNAVAEMTVALMLSESRNIGRGHASIAAGGWRKEYLNDNHPTELRGRTAGLIGFGLIGQKVAQILRCFGMNILFHDPFVSAEEISSESIQSVELPELLRRSDYVSLHARRDPSEPPLIGAAELKLMKPTACLVNTARACLIDEPALIDALTRRSIGGAALDVFTREPLPADSTLRRLDNITLTPHLAGSTLEAWSGAPKIILKSMIEAYEAANNGRSFRTATHAVENEIRARI